MRYSRDAVCTLFSARESGVRFSNQFGCSTKCGTSTTTFLKSDKCDSVSEIWRVYQMRCVEQVENVGFKTARRAGSVYYNATYSKRPLKYFQRRRRSWKVEIDALDKRPCCNGRLECIHRERFYHLCPSSPLPLERFGIERLRSRQKNACRMGDKSSLCFQCREIYRITDAKNQIWEALVPGHAGTGVCVIFMISTVCPTTMTVVEQSLQQRLVCCQKTRNRFLWSRTPMYGRIY